jgi:hypothetical protein
MTLTSAQTTTRLRDLGSRGCSETYGRLEKKVLEAIDDATRPVSLGWIRLLSDRAKTLGDECSRKGWDGYEANPISSEAVSRALLLIELLPEGIEMPDLVPDPVGEISFEWSDRHDRILSVTPRKGTLAYAAILGHDHTQYGKAPVRNSWPAEVQSILTQHFSHASLFAARR